MFSYKVSTERPRILLAATCRWGVAARLAIRFAEAGCHVEAVCPRANPASKTKAVVRTHAYYPLAPVTSFRRAIQRANQDLVVPCDDLAAAHFHRLYESEVRTGNSSGQIATLLERSLGSTRANALVTKRSQLMDAARLEQIAIPRSAAMKNLDELQEWLANSEFPVVLKADGTAAGIGVRIARTRLEAEHAFFELGSPPVFLRVLKRAVIDHDLTLVLPFLMRDRPTVTAQSFIQGRDATTSIACWKGKLLASITFEVVRETKPNGPASVLRVIDNPQIREASMKLVRRLNLSGLYGLDFKIDERNVAYLLEMNPRATQSSHLNIGSDSDPVAGLIAAISEQTLVEAGASTVGSVIALFPNEWQYNPASNFLRSAYHDVPWSEPELVRLCMKKQSKLENWYSSVSAAQKELKVSLPVAGEDYGVGHVSGALANDSGTQLPLSGS